jgi:hypothetical protein
MAFHKDWSQWALGNMQKCGIYFENRHILKKRKQMGVAAIRGIAVHEQARGSLIKKMGGLQPYGVEQAKDEAAMFFEKRAGEGYRIDPDELQQHGSVKAVKAMYKDEAVNLSATHASVLAPVISPIAVEEKITVSPKGYDINIHTIVDLIDAQPKPGFPKEGARRDIIVRDLKTRRKAPFKTEADQSQQLTFQALGYLSQEGKLPDKLGLDVLWQTPKAKKREHRFEVTTRSEGHINVLLRRIQNAVEAVNKGVFTPAAPDSWFCGAKYCEYFHECPYGSGRREQSK